MKVFKVCVPTLILIFNICDGVVSKLANAGTHEREQKIMDDIMNDEEYNSLQRPNSDGGPGFTDSGASLVETNMFVRSLGPFDFYNMDFDIDVTLRQSWRDPRLIFTGSKGVTYVNIPVEDQVWRPDTFFRNEKESTFSMVPSKAFYVRVSSDGTVLHSVRVKSKLHCPMNLAMFPFDTQTCQIMLASYGSHSSDIEYKWRETDPIQVSTSISPGSELVSSDLKEDLVLTSTGSYSVIDAKFTIKRKASYYILTIFIPLKMLVIMSILSFWIKTDTNGIRIIINLITLIFMSYKCDQINDMFPPVAYTKYIDIFTGMCVCFVFFALVASIFTFLSDTEDQGIKSFKKVSTSGKVMLLAKFVYPATFLVFVILYYIYAVAVSA